ncbi:hypothetical protein ACFQ0Q_19750 [Streptomyces aureus]
MAWDEWEQLKGEAAQRRGAGMQLNQAPPAGGGDLIVRQDDLGAVGHEAFSLHTRLGKQVDIAGAGADEHGSGTTMQAAAELKSHHFGAGGELETRCRSTARSTSGTGTTGTRESPPRSARPQ